VYAWERDGKREGGEEEEGGKGARKKSRKGDRAGEKERTNDERGLGFDRHNGNRHTTTDDGVVMAMVAVTTAVGKMRGMLAFPDRDADIGTQKWRPINEARRIRDGVRTQDRGRMVENRDKTKTCWTRSEIHEK